MDYQNRFDGKDAVVGVDVLPGTTWNESRGCNVITCARCGAEFPADVIIRRYKGNVEWIDYGARDSVLIHSHKI